ncbi:MAG: HTH domain-containing protein [Muribaculaceae bacterium]|nr:HTH domain-containing protein [Muribaculaceae bacterium]
MKARQLVNLMAKGIPGGMLLMSMKDIESFAETVRAEARGERRDDSLVYCDAQPGAPLRLTSRTILRALAEAYPDLNQSRLADALGVTRQYIWRALNRGEALGVDVVRDDDGDRPAPSDQSDQSDKSDKSDPSEQSDPSDAPAPDAPAAPATPSEHRIIIDINTTKQ